MLKKIVDIWARLTTPHEDIISEALGLRRRPFTKAFVVSLMDISLRNVALGRQLQDAQTRASRNGCLALLAFGLIGIEIVGVALYFLPK